MWYSLLAYIKFLFKSTNQHGVHSPFVYHLVTQCFYDKTKHPEYEVLKTYRKALLKNNTKISITDLGPGSKKTASKQRLVSEIAKTSGSSLKRTQLLFRLSTYFKSPAVLELGTSLGLATQAMHLGHRHSKITTIEGCPNLSAFTKSQINNENICFKTGDFSDVLETLTQPSFDIVFFDGNHTQEATMAYFETLLPKAHNNTLFIFDDIYWSKGMTAAWESIKNHPKVTVTIDTYFWGFVFFRKEQAKEHFTVRL